MSATIFILRHGIAEDARYGHDDGERRLTAEGIRKMKRAAKGLAALGVTTDVVLSSPLRRAVETATIAAEALQPGRPIEIYTPLAPGHSCEQIVHGLKPHSSAANILLVGHEPTMGELVSYLTTGSPGVLSVLFKRGAMAAIHVNSVPPRSRGTLGWFMTSKQMRADEKA